MKKLNFIALALTVIALTACGKKEATQLVESVSVTPGKQGGGENRPDPSAVIFSGAGTMLMTGSPEMACSTVKAEIFEDSKTYELRKFSYDCSGMTANMDTVRLELRGNELFLGTDKVGEKKDTLTEFTLRDPSGATMGFRFQNEAGGLKLEHTMKANGFEQKLTDTLKK